MAAMAGFGTLQDVEMAYPIIRASAYMTVAGYSVLLYDHFLTLSAEIELIWKGRCSAITIIFLANRYLVPLVYAVDIYDRLGLGPARNLLFCKIWIWLEALLMIFSFMSLHALVAMRVHAFHGGPRWLKWTLWLCGIAYALTTLGTFMAALWVRNDTLAPAPFFNICFEDIAPFLWTVWLPSIAFEGLLFILTITKAFAEARRHIYSPITSILYRDGILYFLAISGCATFTMFVWLLGSPIYVGLAKYWSFAMANVAASRLVLNLKDTARAIQISRERQFEYPSHGPCGATIPTFGFFGNSDLHYSSDSSDNLYDPNGQFIDLDYYSMPAIGTMYPPGTVTHFEAI